METALVQVALAAVATALYILPKKTEAKFETVSDASVLNDELSLKKQNLKASGLYVEAPAEAVNFNPQRPSLFLGMQNYWVV